ncbi:Tetracycline repressor protein class H [Novipirellula galeiformis]|uniref:Tetracycline repressor protein class H n=1 Tax=Novipirellula galeiformis TaxID=2528004 RepID=A0A5C6BG70_9BACT|nr:TetR/AcrR family transcriptional regulator C-terminal domain-containing protein [Novipirellula galeiformis]TWU10296.1 Tetracycline repressor protein class H [Novipirellula galeiformis]
MAKKTVRKSKVSLNRDVVLRTAIQFANQHGIESLSMRKLAELLGVEAMSLYNHVSNKDAILDGIVDIVAGEIELPTLAGDWKSSMRRRAMSAHEVLMRYPWATMLIVSRPNVGPAMLRYVDATIGCLVQAGFSYAMADHAWNAIDSYVYGFTLQKLNFPFQPEEYAQVAETFLPQIPADEYPYLNGMSQQVISGRHDGLHDLQLGLDLILDGLLRMRGPQ